MIREEEHKLYTMMFRGLRDLFYKGNIFTEALKKWRMTDCFEIMGNWESIRSGQKPSTSCSQTSKRKKIDIIGRLPVPAREFIPNDRRFCVPEVWVLSVHFLA